MFGFLKRLFGRGADSTRSHGGTQPIDLAFVVGAIRAHAPELSDDLDDAISVWLSQADVLPFGQPTAGALVTRRSRLEALRELLDLSPYEPDPRD